MKAYMLCEESNGANYQQLQYEARESEPVVWTASYTSWIPLIVIFILTETVDALAKSGTIILLTDNYIPASLMLRPPPGPSSLINGSYDPCNITRLVHTTCSHERNMSVFRIGTAHNHKIPVQQTERAIRLQNICCSSVLSTRHSVMWPGQT